MSFVVVATGTNIGKTLVSALILKQGKTEISELLYLKPIQTGPREDSDLESVINLSGLGEDSFFPNFYHLPLPASPHFAAETSGIEFAIPEIWEKLYQISRKYSVLIEGAGGLMVPWNYQTLWVDLIRLLELPVLLVVSSGLGTINHSLLSIEALRSRSIPILGFVSIGEELNSLTTNNRETISQYSKLECFGEFLLPRQKLNNSLDFEDWSRQSVLSPSLWNKLR